jgi:hypothetical protein
MNGQKTVGIFLLKTNISVSQTRIRFRNPVPKETFSPKQSSAERMEMHNLHALLTNSLISLKASYLLG